MLSRLPRCRRIRKPKRVEWSGAGQVLAGIAWKQPFKRSGREAMAGSCVIPKVDSTTVLRWGHANCTKLLLFETSATRSPEFHGAGTDPDSSPGSRSAGWTSRMSSSSSGNWTRWTITHVDESYYAEEAGPPGLCQPPSAAISASACFGPQVPRL